MWMLYLKTITIELINVFLRFKDLWFNYICFLGNNLQPPFDFLITILTEVYVLNLLSFFKG